MELGLILGTLGAGYYLSNKSSKVAKEEFRNEISAYNLPVGQNIYTSTEYDAVNRDLLKRSVAMYKKAENPSKTGVILPEIFFTAPAGSSSVLNMKTNDILTITNLEDQRKLYDDIRITDPNKPKKSVPIESRPMFKPLENLKGNERDINNDERFSKFGAGGISDEISLLTGKPMERTHNNLVPFFGSNITQNIESFKNESLLDKYTGRDDTFFHKKEVGKFFKNRPENIFGTPLFTQEIDKERYIPSLYRQGEKPFQEMRIRAPIAGTIDNDISLQGTQREKTVNELRPGNDPKLTYAGRVQGPPRVGEGQRGFNGKQHKYRPPTDFVNHPGIWRGASSANFKAPKLDEDYHTILNERPNLRSEVYNNNYTGNASGIANNYGTYQSLQ